MTVKLVKYNPGSKYHLSFRRQLHLKSYFELARRAYDEQKVPSVVAGDLGIDQELAQEFIKKADAIRKFYARLRPQEWVEGGQYTKMAAMLGGTYDQLPRTIDDSQVLARDPFLTNLHFMSDLGLLSKQAATKLTEDLGNTANLDQWTSAELNQINLNDIPQIGPVYALEIFRVLTAWGATPKIELPLDTEKAEKLVRAGLKISSFEDKEICALFRRSASPEVTSNARTALRRAGVGNPAISIVLDVLAI